MRVLVDHGAYIVRIEPREHTVHHHLRDGDLAAQAFAAGFEVNRLGQTLFGLGAVLGGELEALGWRWRQRRTLRRGDGKRDRRGGYRPIVGRISGVIR